jgi:hypothetical protein
MNLCFHIVRGNTILHNDVKFKERKFLPCMCSKKVTMLIWCDVVKSKDLDSLAFPIFSK